VESLLSREGAFLLGNWLLLGLMFAILWGTVWPTLSKELLGHTVAVEKPYFNRVFAPLGLALLFLAGAGPLLPWRRATWHGVWRALQKPLMLALVAAPLLWYAARWSVPATLAFTFCVFVSLAVGYEIWRGVRARRSIAGEAPLESLFNLYGKNRRRYGGYTVHLGLVLFAIGLTGSNIFKIELEPIQLKPGEEMRIGEYTLVFENFARPALPAPEKLSDVAAKMIVKRNGQTLKNRDGSDFALYPNIDTYKNASATADAAMAGQEPQSARRPAIMSTAAHDLYLALIGYDLQTKTATIKAYLNPLVMWIWVSTLFFIGGTLISIWPDRKAAPSAVRVRAAQVSPAVASPSAHPAPSARPAPAAASRPAR
jgi:cytochrome c-type biogenesis protein CcmF